MFDRLLRSLRGGKPEAPSGTPSPDMDKRRLDSLRRFANPESAAQAASSSSSRPTPSLSGVTSLAEGSAEDFRAQLDAVLAVENRALRGYFVDILKDGQLETEAFARRREAAFSVAFEGDPFPLAMDLYRRFPARQRLTGVYASDDIRRLGAAFDEALRHAMNRSTTLHQDRLPFTDAQLGSAIDVMGRLIAGGGHTTNDMFDKHYWQIVRAAAADGWPKWSDRLIAAFSTAFTGSSYNHKDVSALVERLLKETPLSRADVPELVAADDAGARLDGIRAAIVAELGEPYGAAMEVVLDARSGYLDPKNIPALAALRELSPEQRGDGFVRYIDALTGLERHGLSQWGELKRQDGRYRFGIHYQATLPEMSFLFKQLTRRKIVLPDADQTAGRFLDLLPSLIYLSDRKILELVLDGAKKRPGGQVATKLRALIATPMEVHPLREFRIEIEDALRSLPLDAPFELAGSATPPSANEGPVHEPVAPSATSDILHGLPPLTPPTEDLNSYGYFLNLQRHFDNVLDARLYDRPHRDLLDRLVRVREQVNARQDLGVAMTYDDVVVIARANGFGIEAVGLPALFISMIRGTCALGQQIRDRIDVFAPFVAEFPEQARSLSRLVQTLGTKSSPSGKWLAEGRLALGGITPEIHLAMLETLFDKSVPSAIDASGDAALRTLIMLSAEIDPQILGPRLVNFAIRNCYAKQSGHGTTPGMISERVGNACVWALSEMPGGAGISYLARIQSRVNYPKVKAFIDKRLNAAADNAGMTRAELDEVMVPTHGLDASGSLSRPIADGRADIRVDGSQVEIDWIGAGGQQLKSPSTAMSADKETLKEIRALTKEAKSDLAVQVQRLQRIFLEDRDWSADQWRERYVEHPLTGGLARRLVWWVDRKGKAPVAVLPTADGSQLLTVNGEEVDASNARIRLWHPIDADVAAIEAWRERLSGVQLIQPFAQVWREVYIITDAEREADTYSNRWAAHILRQHQTMELARANGWRVTHRVGFDVKNDEPWHLVLAPYGLVAEYWVVGAGGEHSEFSQGGAFSYISTDRLMFHSIDGKAIDSARGPKKGEAVSLADIPPIVFSEVMRHADLFTSVASIGNDPTWLDGGSTAGYPDDWRWQANAYWQEANAAKLEQSAKLRRSILERTIPKLKIADRLSLDDRYLLVQGNRNRYRIHLGAGGAFCGERHICIVPKSEVAPGRVWLPFEGDRTLSIILSKALLLAADDKITDPVILQQI